MNTGLIPGMPCRPSEVRSVMTQIEGQLQESKATYQQNIYLTAACAQSMQQKALSGDFSGMEALHTQLSKLSNDGRYYATCCEDLQQKLDRLRQYLESDAFKADSAQEAEIENMHTQKKEEADRFYAKVCNAEEIIQKLSVCRTYEFVKKLDEVKPDSWVSCYRALKGGRTGCVSSASLAYVVAPSAYASDVVWIVLGDMEGVRFTYVHKNQLGSLPADWDITSAKYGWN